MYFTNLLTVFTYFSSDVFCPWSLAAFVADAAEQAEAQYVSTLTEEQYDEYLEFQPYDRYTFGGKLELCAFVCESLENPDWVTPALFTPYRGCFFCVFFVQHTLSTSTPTRPVPVSSKEAQDAWNEYFKSQSEANEWRDYA